MVCFVLDANANSRWTEKKVYAKNYDSEKLYATSGFKLSFTAYSNFYLDDKDNRGFLVGYMAYGDQGIRLFITFAIALLLQFLRFSAN